MKELKPETLTILEKLLFILVLILGACLYADTTNIKNASAQQSVVTNNETKSHDDAGPLNDSDSETTFNQKHNELETTNFPEQQDSKVNPQKDKIVHTKTSDETSISSEGGPNLYDELENKISVLPEAGFIAMMFLTFSLPLLLLISLAMNYKLLTWRKRYKNQLTTFPENLLQNFDDLYQCFADTSQWIKGAFDSYTHNLKNQESLQRNVSSGITKKYDEIFESFRSLQKNLDGKDKEIERLKKGYDLQIIKKFVSKLIQISDSCKTINSDQKMSDETKKEVNFIDEAILGLVEESGVKQFSIKEGSSTKSEEFGMPSAHDWVKVDTDLEDLSFTVKKTLENGFYIEAEQKEVVRFPKIEVYVKGETNE